MDFGDVTKICHDYTTSGLASMAAVANKPFRFVYTSGVTIERDQTKSLPFLAEYRLMRVYLFFLQSILIFRLTNDIGPNRK